MAANAAAAAGGVPLIDGAGVDMVLAVCGADAAQVASIKGEGFASMADFLIMKTEDVATMTTNLTRLQVNRGGSRIGAVLTKKLEALIYWCHERRRQGRELDANEFSQAEMLETIERMAVEETKDSLQPELPKEFKTHKWISWSKKFENYLWQVKGRNGTPLIYIIRKERSPTAGDFTSEDERRIYQVTHRGQAYQDDNKKVFQVLTQLLSDTPAWTWISRFETTKNGKGAMKALRDHYDGPGEVEKRLSFAYSEIENAHYRSERTFSFEKYVTKLSEAFEILSDQGMAKPEREKVDYLLKGIRSDNQQVIAAKTTVRMHQEMRTSFQLAVDRLSELIGSTFATVNPNPSATRNRSRIAAVRFKGGENGDNIDMVNGVDISDKSRNYPQKEWTKLPIEIRKQIIAARKELRQKKKKKRNVAAASTNAQNSETQEGERTSAQSSGSGNNFGSGAYKKAKTSQE